MGSYAWQLVNASANVPAADGVGHCRHPNGNLFLFGGIYTSPLSGLHRAHESNPSNWAYLGNMPVEGRHTQPVVVGKFDGRCYSIGGDAIGGNYIPQICSWDENGGDFRVDADNVPGLDRILHYAFSTATDLIWGGGQRLSTVSGTAQFMLDMHAWNPVDGHRLIAENVPFGSRGLYSDFPERDGKLYLVGSGSYEDAGWPRAHKHDIIRIDLSNLSAACVNARAAFLDRVWASGGFFDSKLWWGLGGNINLGIGSNGDLNDFWYSPGPNYGQEWFAGPTFPGTRRHAAALFETPGGLIITTGSHYGLDIWKLFKDTFTYGAPHNSATGWGAGLMTTVDRSYAIPAGTSVASIGWLLSGTYSGITPKIVRENSVSNYDVVWNGSSTSHNGGGYQDFVVNTALPNDSGVYRIAFSHSLPASPSEPFSSSGTRAACLSDATGNGVSFPYFGNDGTICTRWAEQ